MRKILLAMSISLLTVACGKNDATAPGTAPGTSGDGRPQLLVTDDGVHIAYHEYGAGDDLVVLIHGWSCDSNYWRAQIDPLREKYHVVALDLAGHGASTRNRNDWSIRAFAGDVSAVAQRVGAKRMVLVGHSMGGPVAVEAAAMLGDRVIGVIGVDTLRNVGLPPPPAEQVAAQLKMLQEDFIGTTRSFVSSQFFTKDADPALAQKIALDMSLAPPEVAIPAIKGLNDWNADGALAAMKQPLALINSDLGGVTDEARLREIHPQTRVVSLKDVGHFLMMEAPDRFNPILLAELSRLFAGQ
ncbi:MAG: alpha/beta hydrolase [Steroidobacteraceae bacterium]